MDDLMKKFSAIAEIVPVDLPTAPKYFFLMGHLHKLHLFAEWSFDAKEAYKKAPDEGLLKVIDAVDKDVTKNLPRLAKVYSDFVAKSVV